MSTTNTYLEDLFSSEVMRWRYTKALGLSLLMQTLLSTLLCNSVNILLFEGSWNPFQWMFYLLGGISKPTWIFTFIMPTVCYIVLMRIHIRSYTVHWWVPDKRLQYITHTLKPANIIYSILIAGTSCLLLRHYASIVHQKFASLTLPCKDSLEDLCVNHQAVMILLTGLIFGCRVSYKYFVGNYKVITFPSAESNYLIRLRAKLKIRTVLESCALFDVGFWLIFSVISIYLLLALSNFLNTVGVPSQIQHSHFLDMLYMILDIRQLITLTFCLVLLSFNLHCFFITFNDIVTQRIELPVSLEDISDNASLTSQTSNAWILSNALVSSCSLLQLLAFKQLKDFSENSTSWGYFYRAQIYSISQPGGHPRNWQSILNPSLNLIRKFTEKLKVNNCIEEALPTYSSYTTKDVNKNFVKPVKFCIKQKLIDGFQSLKQYPLFCYLLSDLPDSKNRQIFSEGQAVIWAIQGLSNLVAASFTDDQYGVVQRNVGDILTTLTQLQQVLEKVGRGIPTKRACIGTNFGSKCQKYPLDLQLRRALKLTVKSSLYTITNTFKDSIRDITLLDDVRSKMESYLAFQEG